MRSRVALGLFWRNTGVTLPKSDRFKSRLRWSNTNVWDKQRKSHRVVWKQFPLGGPEGNYLPSLTPSWHHLRPSWHNLAPSWKHLTPDKQAMTISTKIFRIWLRLDFPDMLNFVRCLAEVLGLGWQRWKHAFKNQVLFVFVLNCFYKIDTHSLKEKIWIYLCFNILNIILITLRKKTREYQLLETTPFFVWHFSNIWTMWVFFYLNEEKKNIFHCT